MPSSKVQAKMLELQLPRWEVAENGGFESRGRISKKNIYTFCRSALIASKIIYFSFFFLENSLQLLNIFFKEGAGRHNKKQAWICFLNRLK